MKKLTWAKAPVLDRSRDRGHGREEIREAKAVSVDGLLFPHARQAVRIHRKRRRIGARKWTTETVHAVTDLPAHQTSAAEPAAWARSHWITENTVHRTKDVTFAEDASQVRRHHTPAAMNRPARPGPRHPPPQRLGNTASGRHAHTHPETAPTLHGIP